MLTHGLFPPVVVPVPVEARIPKAVSQFETTLLHGDELSGNTKTVTRRTAIGSRRGALSPCERNNWSDRRLAAYGGASPKVGRGPEAPWGFRASVDESIQESVSRLCRRMASRVLRAAGLMLECERGGLWTSQQLILQANSTMDFDAVDSCR